MSQRQFYYHLNDSIKGVDQKNKLVSQYTNPEHSSINSYKKSIIQANKCNPIISRARPFIANSKKEETPQTNLYKNGGESKMEEKGGQRIKSMSFANDKNEKISNSARDYLAFAQRHQKLEEARKGGNISEQKLKRSTIDIAGDAQLKLNEQVQQFQRLQNNYRQAVQKCTQMQIVLQQKESLIKSLNLKNDMSNSQMASQASTLNDLQLKITFLQGQNEELRQYALTLQNQINAPSKNREIEININQFKQMGYEFEQKINQLQQQNNKLKNIIGNLQGKVGELDMQKTALQTIVNALQERNSKTKESVLKEEIQYLRKQLQTQKEDKDRLVSKYEHQILKMQNLMQSERYLKTESLLDFSDEERLQEKLMVAISQIEHLRSKLKTNKI